MATTAIGSQGTAQAQFQDSALAKLSGDYTMFLKLLTSQMQNQDPLDPMDTSQYTQQLVQYSQVEQSIQQSATLKDILARLSAQDMVQASSLIGRDADYAGAVAGLPAGGAAHWQWQTDRAPASLVASISDASGQVVERRALAPDAQSFDWDGVLANGGTAAPSFYTLSLDARDASGNALAADISARGQVEAVMRGANGLEAVIGGVSVAIANISAFAL